MGLNPVVEAVTQRILARSAVGRQRYLDLIARARDSGCSRQRLACANLAHGFAASGEDKPALRDGAGMNIAIVSAYNDMLSAHQPYGRYPEQIKLAARQYGATAQVAGGVPAMCDGITQGQPGMELSLFSRDVIAMSTAVALSHAMFDSVLLLGICDKIVPGLLIGALRFGHLPALFIPSGPMPSGLPNKEKARVRELFAEGKADRQALLRAESEAYHSPGTCTFYGTANSNQVMMEAMGLHLPGAAFVPPGTPLRQALTAAAVARIVQIGWNGKNYRPLGQTVDARTIVNGAVALLATGGSTNHVIHLPAIARAAGIIIDWDDIDQLSAVTPLVARVYPNGPDDVNHFHAAGGTSFVIATLLAEGLLHSDVLTAGADRLDDFTQVAAIDSGRLVYTPVPSETKDATVLRSARNAFWVEGGMRLVQGNLGRAIFKSSAVAVERWSVEAPARVFDSQEAVLDAFKAGELDRDVVVVVRFQGPRANGMPELHKLTPALAVLQERGFKVALVTDGRMSGASGKVPAAIHLWPEAACDGPISRIRDGDIIRVCALSGEVTALVDDAQWQARCAAPHPPVVEGVGRELFSLMRAGASTAESGGSAMLAAAGL